MPSNVITLPVIRVERMSDLQCQSVSRMPGDDNSLLFSFNREPTSDEMRDLYEIMERAAAALSRT